MVTGLEPGLEDLIYVDKYYYWEAEFLPLGVELEFDKLGWNPEKCVEYLRKHDIRLISISFPFGSRIHFMNDQNNSDRFWNMIETSPQYFVKRSRLNGRYKYRSIYEVK